MHDRNGTMIDRREMLKIKIKSLAEEARIIRKEENGLDTRVFGGELMQRELHHHRIIDVRGAARTSHIAYGLIRGKALDNIEKPIRPRTHSVWDAVRKMIKSYGPVDKEKCLALIDICNELEQVDHKLIVQLAKQQYQQQLA